ncbi:Ig-like domain-containing protein [Ideonella sp.]|uniref:Ig-like domain-containing protein n=1 Tax=Ideonella sp. TaxID=1929293 RepID=UPI0035B3732F
MKAWALGLATTALLSACGGGGGDPGECQLCGGSDTRVSSLVITLSEPSLSNGGTDTVTATVTALNPNRVAIPGATVEVAVDANAVATVGSNTTDATGSITATIGVGADKSNRTVTFVARSGEVTQQISVQVTGTRVSSSYASTVAPGSADNTIEYLVTDINGVGMAGQAITVSAPGLTSVTGTTDGSGHFTYTYSAPTATGSLVVTATVAGVSDVAAIQVAGSGTVPPATGTVGSASLAVSPSTVLVNTAGSTANQTQVRALFVREDNSAVQNLRVRFDLGGDPNRVGGTFSSGSDMLYSSANGIVTVSYIPGTRSSPTDGVTVRACWDYTDFAAGLCPNEVTTTLTVTSQAISVTLGGNGTIAEGEQGVTYTKQFVAMVVDSAGYAMPGVTITPTVDLTDYRKGMWVPDFGAWSLDVERECANEDLDRDGVLDPGEDIDRDGILEPRKADVSVRMVGSAKTDSSGLALLQIEYPQDVASWVRFQLTVTASGVSGTEGRASRSDWLAVPASAVNSTDSSPAFQESPYGITPSCTVH